MKCCRLAALVCMLIGAAVSTAHAQTDTTLALGWEVGMRLPGSQVANGSNEFGLVWRLGHDETRWGFHWGLNWYASDIDRNIGGSTVELGELHIRPITAGYGYTRVIGRFSITADVLGGFAFTSMSLTPQAIDTYQRIGQGNARIDTSMTWVVRPEIGIWYDINKKFGLVVNTGYTVARPTLTVTTTAGRDVRRLDADMLALAVGLAYSIF